MPYASGEIPEVGDYVKNQWFISIANALDAMLSDCHYRYALPMSHAREEIRLCAGSQFDPKIGEVFLSIPENHWIELRGNLGSPFGLTHLRNLSMS